MYAMLVFCNGALDRVEQESSAMQVLTSIAELLQRHADIDRIVVTFDGTPLFAVDGDGNAFLADGR